MKALWNGAVLAQSDETEVVDGKHFFPPYSIDYRHFRASDTHTTDPQRGIANYYHLDVAGKLLADAAWFYPAPLDIDEITGYITFAPQVQIIEPPS
ncbi:MAG: DUF427 domain-containing protein [Candidatus Velthaea sp.]